MPFGGWTPAALRAAAGADADLLFPGGASDMVEAHSDLADRRMEADAAATDMSGLRLPERVRAVVAARLRRSRPHKDAVRRGLAVLARPGQARTAARVLARTVDALWYAAGDRSADFSWYTKRAILASIYSATLLYWLRDQSEDDAATLAFLDRRLADVRNIGRVRARFGAATRRLAGRDAARAEPPPSGP